MEYRNSTLDRYKFLLVFFFSFMSCIFIFSSHKVMACGIRTGNIEDYEGVIIHTSVQGANGYVDNTISSGYTATITSNQTKGVDQIGPSVPKGQKQYFRETQEQTFYPYKGTNYGCSAGDIVLQYEESSGTSAGGNARTNAWVIGCGATTGHKDRKFTIKMNGVPEGYSGGGKWRYTTSKGKERAATFSYNDGNLNGATFEIWATYIPPPVNIQGTVYSKANEPLNGVPIFGTNVKAGLKTDSSGSFDFDVAFKAGFSIRAKADPFTSLDGHKHSGVKITPFKSKVTKCNTNSTSYELQVAGTPNSDGRCDYGLTGNSGYDFHYTKEQYAKIAVAGTVAPSEAYPGTLVDFSSKAAVSKALSDDGEDTYRITITPSIDPPNSGDTTTFNDSCRASSTQKLYLNASSSSKSLPCQIKIPAGSKPGTQYCVTTSVDTAHDYVDITGNDLKKCVTVLAPPTISLGAAPSHEIGSGDNANISYTVNCKDFSGSITYQISVSSTPASSPVPSSLESTTNNCTAANATLSGTIPNTATSLDGVAPNKYTYSPSITAAKGVPNLPISGIAVILDNYTVPYARFYGADIMSQNGAIVFNVNSLASATGSATEYAAVAKATITLATAAFRSDPVKNTLTAKISAISNISSSNNTSGGTWGNNNWSTSGYFGDITKDQHVSVPDGVNGATGKITVVGANIYIDGNITISTTNLPPPSGNAVFNDASVPSLVFITPGNIYISANVSRIDASLQAGGNIFTCASGNAVASGSNCQTPLTVNGSVGAGGTIKFNRSCGTRLTARNNEDSGINGGLIKTPRSCTISGGGAAEVFNFPNYLYFTSSTGSSASQTQFQSIYSAPPLL